jgi:fumarate reductase flavoprotein subunit
VRAQFKGMVERCADCGFDLAGGLVEVVPTAHYMMGGVEFAPIAAPRSRASSPRARTRAACTAPTASAATASPTPPCSARSRATRWRGRSRARVARARAAALEAARGARAPRRPARGRLEAIREALYDVMWDDVGILRDAAGLARARRRLAELRAPATPRRRGDDLRYNLTWHDWLNLESLITVSAPSRRAASAHRFARRALPRGLPATGDLDAPPISRVRSPLRGGPEVVLSTRCASRACAPARP